MSILIIDKKRKEIILIEVGITSQDQLQAVESEKQRNYDVLANEISAMHGCTARIIPYVLAWDGIVTKFHKNYSQRIGLTPKIEAYIQYVVLKKTLESISFGYRRNGEEAAPEESESVSVIRQDQRMKPTTVKSGEDNVTVEKQ